MSNQVIVFNGENVLGGSPEGARSGRGQPAAVGGGGSAAGR